MKILVTGGSGFIGSYVVDELVRRGHDVIVADITMNWSNPAAKYFELDVRNSYRVDSLLRELRPEIVIHLAGILGTTETWFHVQATIESNINGSVNVYDACAKYGASILTVDVGSRWSSPYTISKRCGAEFAFAYGNKYKVPAAALRIFNVYGPRQGTSIIKIVPRFIERALKNADLEVWGSHYADLVHAKDVGHAFANACERMEAINQVDGILVGSGEKVTVYDTALLISGYLGSGRVVQMDFRAGEERVEAGFMGDDSAKRLLGWEPKISLSEGLPETIEWYRKYLCFEGDKTTISSTAKTSSQTFEVERTVVPSRAKPEEAAATATVTVPPNNERRLDN